MLEGTPSQCRSRLLYAMPGIQSPSSERTDIINILYNSKSAGESIGQSF